MLRAVVDFMAAILPWAVDNYEKARALVEASPRVRHLALHGKKKRTRKKNINRALREYQRRSHK